MMIRTRSKIIMFLFGWGSFPSYVEADTKLWQSWWKVGRRGC